MKEYSVVLRLLIKNMFRREKNKKSKYMWVLFIVLALCYISLAAGLVTMAIAFSVIMAAHVIELLTYIFIIIFVIVLFFGLFPMLTYLYFSKDTEFFLSLPVKPSTIYFAKLSIVYLIELVLVVLIMVPVSIAIGVLFQFGAGYYITMFLAMFLVPAFPLVFCSIISIPIMYVVSFFKRRAAAGSIVGILLFAGVMAGYFYLMLGMQTNSPSDDAMQALVDKLVAVFAIVGNAFYPFKSLSQIAVGARVGNMSLAGSILLNLLIFVGSALLLLFVAVLISNAVYRRGAAKNLENRQGKSKKGVYQESGVVKALMQLEFKDILRNSTYAFQCLLNILICPIFVFIMTFSFSNSLASLNESGTEGVAFLPYMLWFMGVGFVVMMGISTNIAAATPISRQGENFYYSKILPVDYRIQIKAKLYLYMIFSMIAILLSIVILCVLIPNWWMTVLSLVFLTLFSYGYICFAVWMDLRNPKLKWTSAIEAVKKNTTAMISMFVCMGIAAVLLGIGITLLLVLPNLVTSVIVIWSAFFVIAIAMIFVFHNLLFSNIDRLYAQLP